MYGDSLEKGRGTFDTEERGRIARSILLGIKVRMGSSA